jgi:hypothetical protein
MNDPTDGFFVAAFGVDGQMEGIGILGYSELSRKWLGVCGDFLDRNGPTFDARWPEKLEHIRLRVTSDSGVALMTFSVFDRPAASIVLASGLSPATEVQVMEMFVSSLSEVKMVQISKLSQRPFREVFDIKERPVLIVVPWPDEQISDQDHSLIRELVTHTAGAFFRKNLREFSE